MKIRLLILCLVSFLSLSANEGLYITAPQELPNDKAIVYKLKLKNGRIK